VWEFKSDPEALPQYLHTDLPSQTVRKFPTHLGSSCSLLRSKETAKFPQSRARQNQSTFSCLISLRYILTLFSHLLPRLSDDLFPSTVSTKTFYPLLFPYTYQRPRQTYPSWSQAYISPNTSSDSRNLFFA
jgi:hypothetical protein